MPDTAVHHEKEYTLTLRYHGCNGSVLKFGLGHTKGAAAPPEKKEGQVSFTILPEHLVRDSILMNITRL